MKAHWMFLTSITDKERSTVAGMDRHTVIKMHFYCKGELNESGKM